MSPHDDIRGIGEGPPIQVRYRSRVAHGLGPIELRLVAEVVDEVRLCGNQFIESASHHRRDVAHILGLLDGVGLISTQICATDGAGIVLFVISKFIIRIFRTAHSLSSSAGHKKAQVLRSLASSGSLFL